MVTRLTDYTKQFWILLSTDDMDTLGSHNGDEAIVIDQDKRYVFDEENQTWRQIPMSGGGGGDPYAIARSILDGTVTEYIDPELTKIAISMPSTIAVFKCHNVKSIANSGLYGSKCTSLAFPNVTSLGITCFRASAQLQAIDLGANCSSIPSNTFYDCHSLKTLVLRRTAGMLTLTLNAFTGTPFKSDGTGGTIYIPRSLYDHLGDGTNLDYKAATNWATYDSYGTITWAPIEGSIYETQYADGTPIS